MTKATVSFVCLLLCFVLQPPRQWLETRTVAQGRTVGQRPAAPQRPVFRAEMTGVSVNVLVTRGGRPVAGLSADDFQVLDNGVPQQVQLAGQEGPLSAALLIDRSISVAASGTFPDLIAAGRALARALEPADRAWLLTFSHRLALAPVRDSAAMRGALEAIRPGGNTALYDAIFAGVSLVVQDAGRALIVVCTDAMDTASWLKSDSVIDLVKRSNVVVYCVGAPAGGPGGAVLGPGGYPASLARETGGAVLDVGPESSLSQRLTEILAEFRVRYVLTYVPTGVRQDDGWHRLTVRLKGKDGKVRARPGYYASPRRSS